MLRIFILAVAVSAGTASAQITIASAGHSFGGVTAVAYGEVISLFVVGLNVPNAVASTTPLPTELSGVRVVVTNSPTPSYPTALPILSVAAYPVGCLSSDCIATNVVVQFPYEATCIPNGVPNGCTISAEPTATVAVQVNGQTGQGFVFAATGGPHFLNSCDSIYYKSPENGSCDQLITHANGTLVSGFALPEHSPAHPGEEITIYAVGLGPTPHSTTGQAVTAPDSLGYDVYLTPAVLTSPAGLQLGQAIKADWAGLVAGFVGLYQINLQLPQTIPSDISLCNSTEGGNFRLFFGNHLQQLTLDMLAAVPFTDVCITTN